jgi:hypothetical protein
VNNQVGWVAWEHTREYIIFLTKGIKGKHNGKVRTDSAEVSERKEEPMPSQGTSSGELSLPQEERIIYGFDEAATGLAEGTISRGQALKLTGSALLGGGLLALFPGAADAQEGGCANKSAINNTKCPRSRCGLSDRCRCATTVKGKKTCVNFRTGSCPTRNECNRTSDCVRGRVCVKVAGCCGHKNRHRCATKC